MVTELFNKRSTEFNRLLNTVLLQKFYVVVSNCYVILSYDNNDLGMSSLIM